MTEKEHSSPGLFSQTRTHDSTRTFQPISHLWGITCVLFPIYTEAETALQTQTYIYVVLWNGLYKTNITHTVYTHFGDLTWTWTRLQFIYTRLELNDMMTGLGVL